MLPLPSSPSVIFGLTPKLHIIHDRLAIGIAGGAKKALELVDALRASKRSLRDIESIKCFIRGCSQSLFSGINVVGAIVTPENDHYRSAVFDIGDKTVRFSSGENGDCRFAGSGAQEIARQVVTDGPSMRCIKGSPSSNAMAISRALSLISTNTAAEVLTGGGLSKRWGGGFEMMFFADGRFQIFTDVVYVVWHATVVDNRLHLGIPLRLLKPEILRTHLAIRCHETLIKEEGPVQYSDSIHVIHRLDEKPDVDWKSLPPPDFNSAFVVNTIGVELPDKSICYLSHVLFSKERNFIRFTEMGHSRGFSLSTEMVNTVADGIKRHFGAYITD